MLLKANLAAYERALVLSLNLKNLSFVGSHVIPQVGDWSPSRNSLPWFVT